MPPLVPTQLRGDHLIKRWEPGDKVVFYRPIRISIILAILFLFLGLGFFYLLFWVWSAQELEIETITILFLLGSVLGGYGFYGFVECWPRTIIFDWEQHSVIWATLLGKTVTPFSKISELVLQVKMYGGWGGIVVPGPKKYTLSMQMVENRGTHTSISQVFESDSHLELDRGMEEYMPIFQYLANALPLRGRVLNWDGTVLRTI